MLELTYFAAKGTCDVIRLLLAEASQSYRENILSGYDFRDIEDGIEFGTLPLLENKKENIRIVGPISIARYLAIIFRLYGENLKENTQVDMWIETCFDIQRDFWNSEFMQKDDCYQSNRLRLKFVDEYLVPKLAKICQMIAIQEGSFLVGNKFSCAELCLFSLIDSLMRELEVVIKCFPVLVDFHESVLSRPKIKSFCAGPNRY